jgi:hypothetical protein
MDDLLDTLCILIPAYLNSRQSRQEYMDQDRIDMAYGPALGAQLRIVGQIKDTIDAYIDKRIDERLADLGLLRDSTER